MVYASTSSPQALIDPLSAAHYFLPYQAATIPGLTLRAKFTRYSDDSVNAPAEGTPVVSLVLAIGLGLASELWIPFIHRIYEIQRRKEGRTFQIMSIWTIDFANHGGAAVLNAEALTTHFSERFPTSEKTIAVDSFLSSSLLSAVEKANLVAVGHSGGGGGAFWSTLGMTPGQTSPFKTVILVEPPTFSQDDLPIFNAVVRAIAKFNRMKPDFWENVDEAMEFVRTFPPGSSFHEDVLAVMKETNFRPDTREIDGHQVAGVTTIMPIAQETASFHKNGETSIWIWNHMKNVSLPNSLFRLHVIIGSTPGFGPKALADSVSNEIFSNKELFASLSTIQDTDHYVPQEKPYELAARIYEILQQESRREVARL
ncbi:unnamed protein product [Peniophora sp. CBMAI 1063]|nr:unnamed protein product [Peniophora sp. CBMAI 1063]